MNVGVQTKSKRLRWGRIMRARLLFKDWNHDNRRPLLVREICSFLREKEKWQGIWCYMTSNKGFGSVLSAMGSTDRCFTERDILSALRPVVNTQNIQGYMFTYHIWLWSDSLEFYSPNNDTTGQILHIHIMVSKSENLLLSSVVLMCFYTSEYTEKTFQVQLSP